MELHQGELPVEVPLLDPKTRQTAMTTVTQGGRRDLKSTTATSGGLGFSLTTQNQLETTLYYWRVKVQDTIGPLSLLSALQYEDYLPGIVIREPSLLDGVPGPIRSIDIGWHNLGEVNAAGVDLKVRKRTRAWGGHLISEVGATWNSDYKYRELPAEISLPLDRVGTASERGSILRHRATVQFAWENDTWRLATTITEHPSYRDADALNRFSFSVRSQTLVDLRISRYWGASSLTVGATNLFDSEPGYANVSAWGYDVSQGDLRGRFLYGEVRIGF